jgi:hypothetical protein
VSSSFFPSSWFCLAVPPDRTFQLITYLAIDLSCQFFYPLL